MKIRGILFLLIVFVSLALMSCSQYSCPAYSQVSSEKPVNKG